MTSGPHARAIIEPLIRVLPSPRQATDQRIAGRRSTFGSGVGRLHLGGAAP
jgi:hypothetical protein